MADAALSLSLDDLLAILNSYRKKDDFWNHEELSFKVL